MPVPIVIRMEGTNVDEGKRLLRESGMKLTTADSMDEAAKQVNLSVPLVVRMEGTNVVEGKKILAESGIKVIGAADLADAARKVTEAIGVRKAQ